MKKMIFIFIPRILSFTICFAVSYYAQTFTTADSRQDHRSSQTLEIIQTVRKPSTLAQVEQQILVEITVDKKGRVTSAHALSGPLPLQDEAAITALKMRFSPKLKLTKGIIVFKFVPYFDPKGLILPRAISPGVLLYFASPVGL